MNPWYIFFGGMFFGAIVAVVAIGLFAINRENHFDCTQCPQLGQCIEKMKG